ncbi:MAG: hypothetical protein ACI4CT_03595 [Lachnospiraceae bacterium]
MKIACWSPYSFAGAVSSNLLSLACSLALNEERCWIMDMNCGHLSVAGYIDKNEFHGETSFRQTVGLDALIRYVKSQELDAGLLRSCAFSYLREYCLVIPGENGAERLHYDEEKQRVCDVIREIPIEEDEWLFLDLPSGKHSILFSCIEYLDLIVVCLPQNPNLIREFFQVNSIPLSKLLFLISSYQKDSCYSIRNMLHRFRAFRSYNVGVIPYSIQWHDALCNRNALSFFLKNNECNNHRDGNYDFIHEVHRSAGLLKRKQKILLGGREN